MNSATSVTGASLARFAISAIVMATLTLGVASLVVPPKRLEQTSPVPGSASGVPAGFMTVASSIPPTPLGPPPADQLIQLVSFDKDAPPPSFGDRAPWWTPGGIPRVPHITQFDGGPLASANSVMAAGAMLARLAYGISTTGSQLRSLQSNQRDGITLANLEEALQKGGGVDVGRGVLSPLQFRALMYAGAGAVVIVSYGDVPIGLREQPGFLGSHAIYVDAYRPGLDGRGPEYYVMDPIGVSWKGYVGAWWPAEALERAAVESSGGSLVTSWAFARGVVPRGYPSLPSSDYPASVQRDSLLTPAAPPRLEALPAVPPSGDPTAATLVGDGGPTVPRDVTDFIGRRALKGVGDIEIFLGLCAMPTPPAFCPLGVRAVYPSPRTSPPTPPPPVDRMPLLLLYADSPQPGIQRTLFEAPPGITPSFWYWPSDGSGQARQARVEAARLGAKHVWMVTVPIPRPGTYNFVALARHAANGVVSASDVGSISFGN